MNVSVYSCRYKYNLLILYNVTPMYIFGADHLVLDKQLVFSSLGKIMSASLQHSFVACSVYG